jgi:murein DD-endopeptidase MepM/ murein hydrolase activator NlpD
MRTLILTVIVSLSISMAFSQKEKGKLINAPKIPQNKKTPPKTEVQQNQELEFTFEDEPKLRFSNQYESKPSIIENNSISTENKTEGIKIEPLREINETVHEDSSSIDEGELLIVEIEEDAQFQGAENMVGIASYFSVWDTKSINPYGISPKEFDEIIPLKLYDISEGRNWASVLDKTVLTSHFGWRWRRWHKGTDLDLETGDPVYAAFDGIIRVSGVHSGYGRTLILRHYNGLETLYGHMSKLNFEPNTIVKAGEMIGLGGNSGKSSGSHLHFETRYEGNQFDPENIYNFKSNPMQIKGQEFVLSPKLYDYLRGGSSRPANVISDKTEGEISAGMQEDEEGIEEEEEEIPVQIVQKVWYKVKSGDNLTEIARKFHTSVGEIARLNKISSYKKINAGLRLRIK